MKNLSPQSTEIIIIKKKKKKPKQNWFGSFLQNENKGMTAETPLSVMSKSSARATGPLPMREIPFLPMDFTFK